jgi:hypothetical protein
LLACLLAPIVVGEITHWSLLLLLMLLLLHLC